MRTVSSTFLLILCFSACGFAQGRKLAVLSRAPQGLGATAATIEPELARLLSPAGIEVTWHAIDGKGFQEPTELLVVGSLEGSCSAAELPSQWKGSPESSLGETQVASSGKVMPFFRVHCARILESLRPALQHLSAPLRDVVFGRAVARVIAHEIYHILAQAMDHQNLGVAKASFSLEDLTAADFHFDPASLSRMQYSN